MAGGVLLVPLVGVAAWGLALRIGQHGLTPDRIVAAACVLVGAVHAAGYAWAAASSVRGGAWMTPLERTNLLGAVTAAGLILLLFSPVLDPARLSVMDQTARLARGDVTPAEFDYAFLRFESGRVGEAALAKLAASSNAETARLAKAAQVAEDRWVLQQERETPSRRPEIVAWPQGTNLPEGFLDEVRVGDPRWNCKNGNCLAEVRDLDRDGAPEVLLATAYNLSLFARDAEGVWVHEGDWPFAICGTHDNRPDPRQLMRSGQLEARDARWPDLMAGVLRLGLNTGPCGEAVAADVAVDIVEVERVEPTPAPKTTAR
jgi:hypothetical protein